MNAYVVLAFVACCLGGCYGQFDSYYCRYLTNADCRSRSKNEQCGTDGVTYYNDCELSKAYCADRSLHKAHSGACVTTTKAPPMTTAGKTTGDMTTKPMTTTPFPINGSEIAFDIFCLDLFHHDCLNEARMDVCASDNMTYDNLCEYEKAKCMNRGMTLVKVGQC